MMLHNRLVRRIALGLIGLILFLELFYLFLPMPRISALIDQSLAVQGLALQPPPSKGLLPGLIWRRAQLSSAQGELLSIDRLTVRPAWLALLRGRPTVTASARMAGGELELLHGLKGPQALDLSADRIRLKDISFFKTVLGATADGVFWSKGSVARTPQGLNGELKLEVKQLQYSGVKLGAFPLPDAAGLTTQGMVRITNGRARLESFTLQGEGIYMRLSGELPPAANLPLNLTLEIMPKPDFLERQKLVFLLLAKFMVSPGIYQVPVRGTLLKPEIL